MKTKRVTLLKSRGIFLLFALSILMCKEGPVSEVEKIANSYKAVVFREPGQRDGGIDILASGGKLTSRLFNDFKVEGYIKIPAGIGSNFSPTDTTYTGTFTVSNDTVWFDKTGTPLDLLSPFWIKGSYLESSDRPGRWAGFKIILEKL